MNLEASWSVAQDFKEDERGVCEQHSRAEEFDSEGLFGTNQGRLKYLELGNVIPAGKIHEDSHREAMWVGTLSF